MLIDREFCGLILVDVQEKLLGHIVNGQHIEQRCAWLLGVARELQVPVLVSEQYPKGLGATVRTLLDCIDNPVQLAKVNFSCAREKTLETFTEKNGCNTLILIGIESHVCVLQSSLELLADGYRVYVVADAIGSRNERDHHFALQRMQQAGVQIVTAEMVVFEWLKQSGTSEFRRISQSYLQKQ